MRKIMCILSLGIFASSLVYGATYEKVDDGTVKITKEVSENKSLKDLYNLKTALQKDIERKQGEIAQIESQIVKIDQDIQEAQLIGCNFVATDDQLKINP